MSTIGGSSVSDRLLGTSDADIIVGNAGDDKLWGGAGNDLFVFQRNDGYDVIRDFEAGDLIVLSATSPRTVSYHDTAAGIEIWVGGLAGQAADHDTIRLNGIHDFALVAAAVQLHSESLFA